MGNSLSTAPIATIGGNLPSFCPDAHRLFLPDFILNHLKEIIKHFTNKRTDSSAPIPWDRNYSWYYHSHRSHLLPETVASGHSIGLAFGPSI
jgi:hypothetical protein